jgi:hypothetical protein
MIEAKIICSHPCDIPDLGITGLRRGEERWVSISAAQGSADLAKEQAKGNVRVYRKVRRVESTPRRPVPPFVAGSRPQARPRAEPEVVERHVEVEKVVEVERVVEAPSVDVDELARKMKSELLGDLIPNLKDVIAEEVSKAMASQPSKEPQQAPAAAPAPSAGVDAATLESVLERVLGRVGGPVGGTSSGGTSRRKDPDEPLFIPSTIVDKGAKGKITVSSKKTEGTDDLDDAQAALREMKRARRGRKNDSEEK